MCINVLMIDDSNIDVLTLIKDDPGGEPNLKRKKYINSP